ncbi:MAG TPA: hypothetical protein VFK47_15480 [Ktedonobacteraceae bacterium]|nr:hypothetical protein [Ktedonobacteraceae bacterium]
MEKTFKIQPYEVDWPVKGRDKQVVYIGMAHPGGGIHYDLAEWDMEVTFTKKQPKPEVGGTCRTKYSDQLVIMGVNGSWIWVTEDPEDPGWVVDVDDLMDVKPWQPA